MLELSFVVILVSALLAIWLLGVVGLKTLLLVLSAIVFAVLAFSYLYHRHLVRRSIRGGALTLVRFRAFQGTVSIDNTDPDWSTCFYYDATVQTSDGVRTRFLVSASGYFFGIFAAEVDFMDLAG